MDNKFQQHVEHISNALERDRERRTANDPGSPDWIKQLSVGTLAALFLLDELSRDENEHNEEAAFLLEAVEEFSSSLDELNARFGPIDLDNTAVPLLTSMFGITEDQAVTRILALSELANGEDDE